MKARENADAAAVESEETKDQEPDNKGEDDAMIVENPAVAAAEPTVETAPRLNGIDEPIRRPPQTVVVVKQRGKPLVSHCH